MSFNPLALLQERQCAPVYSALDSGNPSAALRQCDSLLAKQPDFALASALRALALYRLGRRSDASKQSDAVISLTSKNKALLDGSTSLLQILSIVLSSLGRSSDEVELLDAASKNAPTRIDVGERAFIAMCKAGQWQRAQQTALRLSKAASTNGNSKKNGSDSNGAGDADLHFWWSMQAYSLVANDPTLPAHQLALPLATRMIQKHLETSPWTARSDEELFLYATILARQGDASKRKAVELLNAQKDLCAKSMTLGLLRTDLLRDLGEWSTLYDEALEAMEKRGDDNWSHVQVLVEAASKLLTDDGDSKRLEDVEARIAKLSSDDKGKRNRGFRLARLELIRGLSKEQRSKLRKSDISVLVTAYFDDFARKACAYEDLAPHATLLLQEEVERGGGHAGLEKVRKAMNDRAEAIEDIKLLDDLYRLLNACKLQRHIQDRYKKDKEALEAERALSKRYWNLYEKARIVGKDLPKTEMQPADDFALLAAQASVVAASTAGGDLSDMVCAVSILESALVHSPKGYRLRVLLIRLLRRLACVDEARAQFEKLGVKSVQLETLGWLLVDRSSSFRNFLTKGSKEEAEYDRAVEAIAKIWREAEREMPEMIAKAFENGTFSRIEEIVDFKQRLEFSLARQIHAVERALCPAESGEDETKRREAVQKALKTVTKPSDQRDFGVLLNLLPNQAKSIQEMTSLTKQEPGTKHIIAMLDIAKALTGIEQSSEPSEAVKNESEITVSEDMTASERRLHVFARDVLDKAPDLEASATAFFEGCLDELKATRSPFPADVLHIASIALQGYQLALRRQINAEAAKASFTGIRELLGEKKGEITPSNPSINAEGNGAKETRQRIEKAGKEAYAAVIDRLQACTS